MKRPAFLLIGILVFTHCTMIPKNLKTPKNDQSSILAIEIRTRAPLRIIANRPATVYLVKLNENDAIDGAEAIIHTNYHRGDYAYVLGIEPGKYAAVAMSYMKSEMEYHTFFDKKTIEKSILEVKPGEVAYAGKFLVDEYLKSVYLNIEKNGDSAQVHYYKILKDSLMGVYFCGTYNAHINGKPERLKFHEATLKYFKKTEWIDIIKKYSTE